MKRAFELGIQVPKTFEGWADFFPRYTMLPWLKGKQARRVQTMREYMRMAFNRVPIGVQKKHPVTRLVHRTDQCAGAMATWITTSIGAPLELWLKNAANKWFPPPKPKVDAHQLSARGGFMLSDRQSARLFCSCRRIRGQGFRAAARAAKPCRVVARGKDISRSSSTALLRANYLDAIEHESRGCAGLRRSLLTGPMIRDAIAASRVVRRAAPGAADHLSADGIQACSPPRRCARISSTSSCAIRARRR